MKYTGNTVEKNEYLDTYGYSKKIFSEIESDLEKKWDKYMKNESFNINVNQKNCKKIYADNKKVKKLKSGRAGYIALMVIIILFCVALSVCLCFFCQLAISMSISAVCLALVIFSIVMIVKKIKSLKKTITDLETVVNKMIKNEMMKISTMTRKYSFLLPLESFKNYTSLNLDILFNDNFINMFSMPNPNSVQYSDVISGYINSNPFTIYSKKTQEPFLKEFSASKAYPYLATETYSDQNGHMRTRTVTRMEVVTATTTKTNIYYPISKPRCIVNTYDLEKNVNYNFPTCKTKGFITPKMENPLFNKKLKFETNDELGFRTIFTILAQENFLRLMLESESTYTYVKKDSFHLIDMDGTFNVAGLYDNTFLQNFDYKVVKESYIESFMNLFKFIY